jgi:hypothetical protein
MTRKGRPPTKTYLRQRTHTAIMGSGGKGKPMNVIDGDRLMEYVGIGWIEIRKATGADREKYPVLVDDERA